jgi:antitoxin (DNA-binding transcriptional repressor) of toxin-antitoxin stability system
VKAVEMTPKALAGYGLRPPRDTWVLTRHGKPIAAVIPISREMDLESFGMSHNAEFIRIINRAWKSYERKGGKTRRGKRHSR